MDRTTIASISASEEMDVNIGVVGTGNMGRSLGLLFAAQGHTVFFGSRNPDQGKAAVALANGKAQSGTNQQAAAFGELLIWGVRGVPASSVVADLTAIQGKVVIDMNNNETRTDGGIGPVGSQSAAEKLQSELPGARVVKAFNTLPMEVFEVPPEELNRHRVSVFVASDDPSAKSLVLQLAGSLGFNPVDFGALRSAAMLEGISDVIRHLIGKGVSPFSSISLVELTKPETTRLGGRAPSRLK